MIKIFRPFTASVTLFFFLFSTVFPFSTTYAGVLPAVSLPVNLPLNAISPAFIKGLTVDLQNPFQMDFIVDLKNKSSQDKKVNDEVLKLVQYFLASLTLPEDEMWVNLSPVEKDRIIPESLGKTVLGKELLNQDYLLKKLSAELMDPESESGKKFWDKVKERIRQQAGETSPNSSQVGGYSFENADLNILSKIWIVPDKAVVYEHNNSAFVVDSHLKIMIKAEHSEDNKAVNILQSTIIPQIEKEVNTGETFAELRQIYNSMILAVWYKMALKESLLNKVYADQDKVAGINHNEKQMAQDIYEKYLKLFQEGVSQSIKEEYDPLTQQMVEKKYFTGGLWGAKQSDISRVKDFSLLSTEEQDNFNRSQGLYRYTYSLEEAKSVSGEGDKAISKNENDEYELMSLEDIEDRLKIYADKLQDNFYLETSGNGNLSVYMNDINVDYEFNDVIDFVAYDGGIFVARLIKGKVNFLHLDSSEYDYQSDGSKFVDEHNLPPFVRDAFELGPDDLKLNEMHPKTLKEYEDYIIKHLFSLMRKVDRNYQLEIGEHMDNIYYVSKEDNSKHFVVRSSYEKKEGRIILKVKEAVTSALIFRVIDQLKDKNDFYFEHVSSLGESNVKQETYPLVISFKMVSWDDIVDFEPLVIKRRLELKDAIYKKILSEHTDYIVSGTKMDPLIKIWEKTEGLKENLKAILMFEGKDTILVESQPNQYLDFIIESSLDEVFGSGEYKAQEGEFLEKRYSVRIPLPKKQNDEPQPIIQYARKIKRMQLDKEIKKFLLNPVFSQQVLNYTGKDAENTFEQLVTVAVASSKGKLRFNGDFISHLMRQAGESTSNALLQFIYLEGLLQEYDYAKNLPLPNLLRIMSGMQGGKIADFLKETGEYLMESPVAPGNFDNVFQFYIDSVLSVPAEEINFLFADTPSQEFVSSIPLKRDDSRRVKGVLDRYLLFAAEDYKVSDFQDIAERLEELWRKKSTRDSSMSMYIGGYNKVIIKSSDKYDSDDMGELIQKVAYLVFSDKNIQLRDGASIEELIDYIRRAKVEEINDKFILNLVDEAIYGDKISGDTLRFWLRANGSFFTRPVAEKIVRYTESNKVSEQLRAVSIYKNLLLSDQPDSHDPVLVLQILMNLENLMLNEHKYGISYANLGNEIINIAAYSENGFDLKKHPEIDEFFKEFKLKLAAKRRHSSEKAVISEQSNPALSINQVVYRIKLISKKFERVDGIIPQVGRYIDILENIPQPVDSLSTEQKGLINNLVIRQILYEAYNSVLRRLSGWSNEKLGIEAKDRADVLRKFSAIGYEVGQLKNQLIVLMEKTKLPVVENLQSIPPGSLIMTSEGESGNIYRLFIDEYPSWIMQYKPVILAKRDKSLLNNILPDVAPLISDEVVQKQLYVKKSLIEHQAVHGLSIALHRPIVFTVEGSSDVVIISRVKYLKDRPGNLSEDDVVVMDKKGNYEVLVPNQMIDWAQMDQKKFDIPYAIKSMEIALNGGYVDLDVEGRKNNNNKFYLVIPPMKGADPLDEFLVSEKTLSFNEQHHFPVAAGDEREMDGYHGPVKIDDQKGRKALLVAKIKDTVYYGNVKAGPDDIILIDVEGNYELMDMKSKIIYVQKEKSRLKVLDGMQVGVYYQSHDYRNNNDIVYLDRNREVTDLEQVTIHNLGKERIWINPASQLVDNSGLLSTDRAVLRNNKENVGGIDLNAKNLNLQVLKDDKGALLPDTRQLLMQINIDGLKPVLIHVEPFK